MNRIAIFRAHALDAPPDVIEARRQYAESIAEAVSDHCAFFFGLGRFEVNGYALPYEGSNAPTQWPFQFASTPAAREYIAEHDLGDFDIIHVRGGTYTGACGLAIQGSGLCASYVAGRTYACADLPVVLHEIGHAHPEWALGHAGTIERRDDGSVITKEYGSFEGALMSGSPGNGTKLVGINAPNLYRMGLLQPDTAIVSGEYQIAAAEIPEICLRDGECRALHVMGAEHDYILSHRKAGVNYPFALPEKYRGTVFVHRLSPRNSTHRMLPDMRPGDTKSLDGIEITHLGYEDESVEVRVEM